MARGPAGLSGDRTGGRSAGRYIRRFIDEWPSFDVIELDQDLAQRAVALALAYGLRSLDAIHLAAALTPDSGDVTMATFDDRLWGAAKAHGLEVVPRVRPTSALR